MAGYGEPPRAMDAAAPQPGAGARPGPASRALRLLSSIDRGCLGLFDAARNPAILPLIEGGDLPYRSLYQGDSAEIMRDFAPYLVDLSGSPPLLGRVVEAGWGDSWGIFLVSDATPDRVRAHLRRFTMVTLPGGRPAYFRFYDPRVLRRFLPTCSPQQIGDFFGGVVDRFLVEAAGGRSLLSFGLRASRLVSEEIPLIDADS